MTEDKKTNAAYEADEKVPTKDAACAACDDNPADAPDVPIGTAGDEFPESQWREALETAVAQRDEYLAMAQRAQADFINFKRRNQTIRTDAYDDGVRETLAALLPVVDTLERAVSAVGADSDDQLAEGVRMTLKQMLDAMGKLGLEEVPAEGEEFDPELHNAVMREHSGEPGKILEVFEKGYRVKERIIRYAMVKVAVE